LAVVTEFEAIATIGDGYAETCCLGLQEEDPR
jgi:hypothetical protein